MVAAAAEAVVAPDLADVEADRAGRRGCRGSARCCATARHSRRRGCAAARRAPHAPASAALRRSTRHGLVVAHAVRAAAVADDVVVEDWRRRSSPAPWRNWRAPCRRTAPAPRPTARHRRSCRGTCASTAPAPPRAPPPCPSRRHWRRARRRRVHHVGHAAVDMAGDDDDVVGPLGAALDRDHVATGSAFGMRAPVNVSRIDDRQAAAAGAE
jgi:hypothetical protein